MAARKEDLMAKELFRQILEEGTLDVNPRPHYKDGTPAHTLSENHFVQSYDLSKGEFPLITLRPIAIKSSIGELLWIYQDQSNNLDLLRDKYGVTWWDEWDIGDRTIGCCYGETVRRHGLMDKFLDGIRKDPDGRRHIIDLWQEEDFEKPHGLKPCVFLSNWNVKHGKDGVDYLDLCIYQRSSDYATAGCINKVQYCVFLVIMAHCLGYKPRKFTWFGNNVQIYDRHIDQVKEMLNRESIECKPRIEITTDNRDFYSIKREDIKLVDYPIDIIKKVNPQLKFEIAI